MKYTELVKKVADLDEATQTQFQNDPLQPQRMELYRARSRTYDLGPVTMSQAAMVPNNTILVVSVYISSDDCHGLELRIGGERRPQDFFGLVTPSQWRLIAVIRERLGAYTKGEIDELPPSGAWPL